MLFSPCEVSEIEKAANAVEPAIRELADLELTLVGGGHGDVVL